jgi:spore maturation protein B
METVRNAIALVSVFVIPLILVGFPLYGLAKRVPVYETFVEGAKEGFQVSVRIIPYLVAILFAVAMFRSASPPRCCRWRSSGRSPARGRPRWWWT